MKIRMILMTFISASCLSAMSTKDAPPSDYGVPTNSVVATPVGYEKRITLDTGETVRMYPDKLSPEEYAKCRAALFCILSPDTLRGKYFLYNCSCPCRMCYIPMQSFIIGKHYSFHVTGLSEVAFELGQPGGPCNTTSSLFDRLYCSTDEVDQRLQELDEESRELPGQIQNLQDELSMLPKSIMQLPKESRGKVRRKKYELQGRIYGLQERLTNGIPYVVRYVKGQRDRLLAHGGAITNHVEPDRLCWNEHIRELATCKLPSLTCRDKTLDEILSDIESWATSNGVSQHIDVSDVRMRGNVPSDARWARKYNIVLPAGSVLEMLRKVGTLPEVSMNVTRRYDWWHVTYSMPGDSPYVDWSKSVFSRTCPKMELNDVTASEAMEALYKIQIQYSGNGAFRIGKSLKDDVKHSFSFTGKTLRAAISELEQALGVVYDYKSGYWFDPNVVPKLGDAVALQMCEKSVLSEDRTMRCEIVLDAGQVKMLNEMMERCDLKLLDFVCCDWFLQDGDPVLTIRYRCQTYGILTDDAKKEAVGFDLGSGYGDSRDSDSRQQHYVRVLRSEKDRRELYSFLLKAKGNSLRREPQAGHGGLTLMMPPYLRTAHEGL